MSLYQLFRILDNINLLENLTTSQHAEFKGTVNRIVLDTDMTKHFNVAGMCSQVKENIDELKEGELLEIEKRRALMSFVVHCCDISNPTMPFEDFKDWGLRIT